MATKHILLKVELAGSEPSIWRRLTVPADLPLSSLHDVIQIAMGWTNSHLYEFSRGRERLGPPNDDFGGPTGARDDSQIEVRELLSRKGSSLSYMYDFGDSWDHLISCEGKAEATASGAPEVLAGERACPPEDIGGIHAFTEMVQQLGSKGRSRKRSEAGPLAGFDPTAFDQSEVNDELHAYYLAFLSGEIERDFDEEDDEGSGVWDVPLDPANENAGEESPFPLDNFGQPVLYDPNDLRGPDPNRWAELTEEEQVAAVAAYHEVTGQSIEMLELHASAHTIVEHHLLSSGLPSAKKALKRALAEGLNRHDAIHALSHITISIIADDFQASIDKGGKKKALPGSSLPGNLSEKAIDAAYKAFDVKGWLAEMGALDE